MIGEKKPGFFLLLGSLPVWKKAGFLARSRFFVLYTGYCITNARQMNVIALFIFCHAGYLYRTKKMSEQRNPAFFLSGEKPAVQKKAGFLAHYRTKK